MANTTVANVSCDCPVPFIANLESIGLAYTIISCVLAIVSNLLTILVLGRVQNRSTTEKLLLVLTAADLILPIISIARYIHVAINKFEVFGGSFFYMWLVFYGASVLLTLLLAVRQFTAIECPCAYNFLNKAHTTRNLTFAIFVFCTILFLPICLIPSSLLECHDLLMTKDIFKTPIIFSIVNPEVASCLLRFTYRLRTVVFHLLCPLCLAGLTLKFLLAMRKLSTMNQQSLSNETKMIFILCVIVMARDLPLYWLTVSRHYFQLQTDCLSSLRSWVRGITIMMSALNLVILYFTNEKFKAAMPSWARHPSNLELFTAATLARLRRQPGI